MNSKLSRYGSLRGRGQRVLQLISLNTLVDIIREPKTMYFRNIDIKFKICLRSAEKSRLN